MLIHETLPSETTSLEATMALGEKLSKSLQRGDILALYGDLGAGKTHLVKGIAKGFGVDPEEVTSPTFTLIQEYDTDPPLYHLDVYRIESLDELERMGVNEYLHGDGICVIEWPERMEAILPEHTIRLTLSHVEGNRRRFELR
ncbi:MAG: tRNA (adenosine(37)-N6)-threonylcarbamoyltransferase complex ATPase subunit type 1 TsaE [Rubricoccaceae bacterium]|nr:tRNA (adenosine(37)-N6)-threonylcarbamoyltransferase complex ATPase subunit type 1 TsaE [Rubricoccaceae bacterium]